MRCKFPYGIFLNEPNGFTLVYDGSIMGEIRAILIILIANVISLVIGYCIQMNEVLPPPASALIIALGLLLLLYLTDWNKKTSKILPNRSIF